MTVIVYINGICFSFPCVSKIDNMLVQQFQIFYLMWSVKEPDKGKYKWFKCVCREKWADYRTSKK